MKHILITFAAVLLVGCFSASIQTQFQNISPLNKLNDVNSNHVFIAAHRGGYERDWDNRAPENSVANIKKSIRMGFEIYESDLQVSKDGHLIIMHDPTVDRTTNGKGFVRDLNLSDLKQLKLKYKNNKLSRESVPTLEDFLVNGKDKILFKIDFKGPIEFFPDAVNLLKKHDMLGQVFFRFDWSKKVASDLAGFLSEGMPTHPNLILFKTRNSEELKSAITQFNPSIIELYLKDKKINDDTIKAIKIAKDKETLIGITSWGGEAQWQELINLGFRMFHTKKPEAFSKFLNKR